jgi:hypothetical protein
MVTEPGRFGDRVASRHGSRDGCSR